jgi:hypothetical protein
VSYFEQTNRRPGCLHYDVRLEYEHPDSSESLSGAKKEIPNEDPATGHALAFKGITHGQDSHPPSEYERAGRGFGICQQLGFWKKRCARPLCL